MKELHSLDRVWRDEFWSKMFKAQPDEFVITSDNKKLKGDLKGVSIIFPIKFEKKKAGKEPKKKKSRSKLIFNLFSKFPTFQKHQKDFFCLSDIFHPKSSFVKGFHFSKGSIDLRCNVIVWGQCYKLILKISLQGEQHSTIVSIIASRPSCPWFDSRCSQNIFRGKIIDVSEVNQHRYFEESG